MQITFGSACTTFSNSFEFGFERGRGKRGSLQFSCFEITTPQLLPQSHSKINSIVLHRFCNTYRGAGRQTKSIQTNSNVERTLAKQTRLPRRSRSQCDVTVPTAAGVGWRREAGGQ